MRSGRRTLARPVECAGTTLHCGAATRVRFAPAPAGSGIVFRRLDRAGPPLPALVDHVTATDRRTALGGTGGVDMVEHVLAAIWIADLDDVAIGVDGPAPPAMDGSAAAFVAALTAAGSVTRPGTPAVLTLNHPLRVTHGAACYEACPSSAPHVSVTIEIDHPLIGRQQGTWACTPAVLSAELAAARTFGFQRDAAPLRLRGLAAGASPANVLILSETGASAALRWPDEFVRHKALDLIGDLMLAGARVQADISATRPSHAGNVALARAFRRLTSTVEHPSWALKTS